MRKKRPDDRRNPRKPEAPPMKLADAIREIQTKPTVPLWPVAAAIVDVSRGAIYQAAREGKVDFDVITIGRQKKAVSASLRNLLGIEAA